MDGHAKSTLKPDGYQAMFPGSQILNDQTFYAK